MAHRADIAGSSIGQTAPAMACAAVRRMAPLVENNPSPEPPPVSCSSDKSCCRPFMKAAPADRAIYPEPLAPESLDPEPFTP
jgi:hypothetical protein